MKKIVSSVVVALILFTSLGSINLTNVSAAEACPFYANGRHKTVLVGTSEVARSGGTHSAVIKKPDGSQHAVNCTITNVYELKSYNCACGTVGSTQVGSLMYSQHQYNH